jgi:radical SAM superfamily enzyme YgiQ (UPF0313 family)
MKILVINQPFIKDFCRCQRWPARTRGRALRPPDWLCYCAAVLRENNFTVELYDFVARRWDKLRLRRLLREKKPDFVVLDSTTPSIYSDIECARICREETNTAVIMVGTHASALPEETLSWAGGAIDVIALGEFDYTVKEIIAQWGSLDEVKGICYRKNGEIRFTSSRPFIQDLDRLPFPAWGYLDIRKYFDPSRLYPYLDIIGGRGCPYSCSFCQWPQLMFGHEYRLRSAGNIVDEIEYDLKLFPRLRHGEFFFEDDTFTVNQERAFAICAEIQRRNLKINWSANSRPDNYNLKLFRDMKRAGCRQLLVGFESGEQSILDKVKKGLKVQDSKEFVRVAKSAGIAVHGCFVFGLPGENRVSARRTLDFALGLGLDTIQFSAAVPLPGTAYFSSCQKDGLLKAKSWQDWLDKGEQAAIVDYPQISSKEINRFVDTGLKRFYLRPRFMRDFLLDRPGGLYRKFRGAYNFLSYLASR